MFTPTNQTFGKQNVVLNLTRLPARLNADQAAALLGFMPHDIPILIAEKLLKPLGKPPANGIKWFATCIIEELTSDTRWLDAATRSVTQHWRSQNANRRAQQPAESAPDAAP